MNSNAKYISNTTILPVSYGSHTKGRITIQHVSEQSAEENIRTQQKSTRKMEKIT